MLLIILRNLAVGIHGLGTKNLGQILGMEQLNSRSHATNWIEKSNSWDPWIWNRIHHHLGLSAPCFTGWIFTVGPLTSLLSNYRVVEPASLRKRLCVLQELMFCQYQWTQTLADCLALLLMRQHPA